MFSFLSFVIFLSVIIHAIKNKRIGYGGGLFTMEDSPGMYLFLLGLYVVGLIASIVLMVRSFLRYFF